MVRFPDLPDDLAMLCLIRLRISAQVRLRSVCKRWHHLLTSEHFHALRMKDPKLVEEWFLIVSRNSLIAYSFQASSSHRIRVPDQVDRHLNSMGFGCLSSGHRLFILGGSTTSAEGLSFQNHTDLTIFNAARGSWGTGASMMSGRSFFAYGCIDETLYVVGGESSVSSKTAEAYDIRSNKWSPMADLMPIAFDRIESFTVFRRKLFIKGLVSGGHQRRVLVLNPRAKSTWECDTRVENGLRKGEFVATDDHLYIFCRQTGYVGRFDEKSEVWTEVGCFMPFLSSSHPQDMFYITATSGENLADLKRSRKALLRAVWQCPGAIVNV